MKKKHRDITVDGKQYGWTVNYGQHLKIWEDKKIIAEYDIPNFHDITPKIVAELIKDPVLTLLLLNTKPCPFCGENVKLSEYEGYVICEHNENCWLYPLNSSTVIHEDKISVWNKRYK